MILLGLVSLLLLLIVGAVRLLQRQHRQRRPSRPRPTIPPTAQAKMARAITSLITSGGMRELKQVKQMAKGYALKAEHFEALAVPPEEDGARANLIRLWSR